MSAMAAQGRNIRLSKHRVAGYRAFSTKLWNAARFAQMNGCELDPEFDPTKVKHTLNRWIVGGDGEGVGRGAQGHRGVQVQRGGGGDLSLHLERLLRLVSRTDQAVC